VDRHFTVSAFVVHAGRLALHWHRRLGAWLPAGGHLEPGEDPAQAALREVKEEFGLEAEVIESGERVRYLGGPTQLAPPRAVLNYVIEPGHEHVDFIYYCRVTSGFPGRSHDPENPIAWVDAATLREGALSLGGCGVEAALAPDVIALGIEALTAAAHREAAPA
jgi:8-oxo-dGTP pyrophosphatase MutT (NUDIX family)